MAGISENCERLGLGACLYLCGSLVYAVSVFAREIEMNTFGLFFLAIFIAFVISAIVNRICPTDVRRKL